MNQVASMRHKAKQIIHASVFNVNAPELQTPVQPACTRSQVPSASSLPTCGNRCHAHCCLSAAYSWLKEGFLLSALSDTFNLLHSYLFSNFFIRKTSLSKQAWFQLINISTHIEKNKRIFHWCYRCWDRFSCFIRYHVILHYKQRLLYFYCKCTL